MQSPPALTDVLGVGGLIPWLAQPNSSYVARTIAGKWAGIDGQCGNSLMVPPPFCSRLAGKMRNRRSAFGMPFPTIPINGTFPTKAEAQPCECSAEVPPRLSIDWIPLLRDFHDLGKSLTEDERSLFTSCLSPLVWDRPYSAKTRHATLCSSI